MKEKERDFMKIDLQRIDTGFRGDYCYTHARAGMTPEGFAVVTMQPLRLSGSDIFYGMRMMKSADAGKTWSSIEECKNLKRLSWRNEPGCEHVFCDGTPFYHRATGKLILTGHNAVYLNDELYPEPRPRSTVYSVYDEKTGDFEPFRLLELPESMQETHFSSGAGCTQIIEEENGNLLIPIYHQDRTGASDSWHTGTSVCVLRCAFDGKNLTVVEAGNSISVPVPRGLGEPSLVKSGNEFFVALRNDESGFVARSPDGLHLDQPVPLCFDDGQNAGNYNTQQHWITGGGRLYMVYTRRGVSNDHIFRHRAPLFIAEFDPVSMKLIRATEQVAVPERGARLGNFGCLHVSDDESWVVVSEWMQTTGPDYGNWRRCMEYGSDNSVFIAKIRF